MTGGGWVCIEFDPHGASVTKGLTEDAAKSRADAFNKRERAVSRNRRASTSYHAEAMSWDAWQALRRLRYGG